MSEISVNSVSNISSSNYVSNKSSLSMEQKQEEVNISNPETIVEISSAGKELLSSKGPYSVKQTIRATIDVVEAAMERTKLFYNRYDSESSSDHYVESRDIRNSINKLWDKNDGLTNYSIDEWSQHGEIINGRRTVTEGPADVRIGMTSIFNDLSFNSKKEVQASYDKFKYAYHALETSL